MRTMAGLAIGVASFLWLFGAVHAATDPPAACKATKARAAGQKAADLLQAFGKNVKRPDSTRLGFSISKAQSKLTKQFSKAESKGGCETSDDAAAIEAKVDAMVSDIVGDVVTTTTTTSTTTSTTSTTTTTTTTTLPLACDCCAVADQLSFTVVTPSGNCGVLRNFRCSNNSDATCVTDGDCDFGSCVDPPGRCSEDLLLTCSGSGTPCTGTCNEIVALNLPLDLECGGLYLGGGLSPLPVRPLTFSDAATLVTDVTACNSGTGSVTLGSTTAAETGSDRTCTSAGCRLWAPVPIPSAGTGSASLCAVPRLSEDTGGAGTCEGVTFLDFSVEMDVYLVGDLLSSTSPPDVPGVQPCPLCVRQCGGGTNDRVPCIDDSDCTGGGTCGAATQCLGGGDDGDLCVPGTTALGSAFPTSPDCLVPPYGGLIGAPVAFDLTLSTADVTVNGSDSTRLSTTAPVRVLCGYCRDLFGAGSLRFEGDPAEGGSGTAVPCSVDADCDDGDAYESCDQRDPGAFSEAAATQFTVVGAAPGACLADGLPAASTLASAFCVPPTFDATVDAAFNLPGPGALTLQGDMTLVP